MLILCENIVFTICCLLIFTKINSGAKYDEHKLVQLAQLVKELNLEILDENDYHVISISLLVGGRRGRDRMLVEFKLPMQSVPITTDVVSSNRAQAMCTQYNIM